LPTGFWGQLAAFILFRYFDAAKPGPVAWADQLFKGFGWRGAAGVDAAGAATDSGAAAVGVEEEAAGGGRPARPDVFQNTL
jgi:hypothetical protein